MLDNLQKYEIILASNSPRRRELLTNLGITFSPFVIFGIDESYPSDLKGEEVALFVAEKKAAAYKEHIRDNRLIITADTIVSTAEGVLGKPQDEQAARDMLRLISGREHTVTTAFTLNTTECHVSRAVTTVVRFAPLTDEMIEYYIRRFLPLTKPVPMAFKNGLDLRLSNRSNGSYSTWWLPTQQLYEALSKL